MRQKILTGLLAMLPAYRCAAIFLLSFAFVPYIVLAGRVTYTLVDEKLYDIPAKTQVEQHIVVSGVPTKAGLETEVLKRYRAAKARRGFQYNNPASNIYIYVYGTKEQARAGQGLWIAMLAHGPFDRGNPRVVTSKDRLAALSQPSKRRLGLSEAKRRQVYREIAASESRATREARAKVPDSQIMKQIKLEGELIEKYKAQVARKYELNVDQLAEIIVEGIKKGWPAP